MIRLLAALAVLLYSLHASAQVVTCAGVTSGQPSSACSAPSSSNAPQAADMVLWCGSGSTAGQPQASCSSPTWLPYANRQTYSWLLTTYAGWQQSSAITFASAAPTAPPPPPCLPRVSWPPKAAYGSIPSGVSTRAEMYASWVCEAPTGYTTVAWLFNSAEIGGSLVKYARGLVTKAQADASCAATCWIPNAAEQVFLDQQIAINQPRALVAFNGAKATRSVFAANADGSLNPVPIAGSSVAVAATCNYHNRLAGTQYYDVTGAADASKSGSTLQGAYSLCVVSLPIGSN